MCFSELIKFLDTDSIEVSGRSDCVSVDVKNDNSGQARACAFCIQSPGIQTFRKNQNFLTFGHLTKIVHRRTKKSELSVSPIPDMFLIFSVGSEKKQELHNLSSQKHWPERFLIFLPASGVWVW